MKAMPNDSSAPVTQAILDTTLQKHLSAMQSELISYVDLKHEQLLQDFRGIFADRTEQQNEKISDHEQRIHAVEATLELAA